MANPVDLTAAPEDGSLGDSAALGGPTHQPLLSLTEADLQRLLDNAVRAGAAQARAGGQQAAQPVPVEVPDDWDDHTFYREVVNHLAHGWYSEREHRSALAYVNKTWPPAVGEE